MMETRIRISLEYIYLSLNLKMPLIVRPYSIASHKEREKCYDIILIVICIAILEMAKLGAESTC